MDSNLTTQSPQNLNTLASTKVTNSDLYKRLSIIKVGKVKFMGKGRGAAKPTYLISEIEATSSEANKKAIFSTRELYKSDKNAYTDAKQNTIPAFYISQDFKGNPTYIGCLDIDRKDNLDLDMEAAKKQMQSFSWVMVCANSLSGDGFYILFPYTEGKDHKQAIQAAIDELLLFGIVCDTLKEINRLRAYSFDADNYINWIASTFDFEETVAEPKALKTSKKDSFSDDFEQFANLTVADDFNQSGLAYFNDVIAPEYGLSLLEERGGNTWYHFEASTNKDSMVVFTNTDVPLFTIHSSTLLAHLVANGAPKDKSSFNLYDLTRYLTGKAPFDLTKELSLAGFGFGTFNEAQPITSNRKESYSSTIDFLEPKNLKLNQLTGFVEIAGSPLNDTHTAQLITELSLLSGKNQSKDILQTCIDVVSNKNQYHPFIEMLEELKQLPATNFSELHELEKLNDCFTSSTPRELRLIYLFRWMLGLFDLHILQRMTKNVLILAGSQNSGKTSYAKNVLPEPLKQYGKVVEFNINKMVDAKVNLCSTLIAVFDEFEDILTKSKSLSDFKNLTSSHDIFERRPFRRNPEQMFRSSIIMATTNEKNILTDSTGNTRFLTIDVQAFDLEKYFKIDLLKVWRVVYDLHLSGQTSVLTDGERSLQANENINFESEDFVVGLIENIFFVDPDGFITSTEILIELERQTKQSLSIKRVGQALRKMGVDKAAKKIKGKVLRGYNLKFSFEV
jgi:hypothetical protein